MLHVINNLSMGGVQNHVLNTKKNLISTNIKLDILVQTEIKGVLEEEFLNRGSNIFRTTAIEKNPIKFAIYLNKLLKDNPYDVIHCHQNFLSIIPLTVAKFNNVPIRITHGHSKYEAISKKSQVKKFIFRNAIEFVANNFIACSEEVGVWMFKESTRKNRNFNIIKNAINIADYTFDSNTRSIMRRKLLLENQLVLVHVGAFAPVKNHEFLLDIFKEIKLINSNSKLLLLGEGELKSLLMKKVEKYKLNDDVMFIGNSKEVSKYLMSADAFVFPSIFEGLPISLIEAQASNLPCFISSNIPDEAVINKNVYKIQLSDPKRWAELINNKRTTTSEREEPNFLMINKGYEIKDQTKKIIEIYIGA